MPDEKKKAAEAAARAADETQAQANDDAATERGADEALDFEDLDLSVESVDERISPSETNVFDK